MHWPSLRREETRSLRCAGPASVQPDWHKNSTSRAIRSGSARCAICWRNFHYSLQSTRKTREGLQRPDRDAQFRHIAAMVEQYQSTG